MAPPKKISPTDKSDRPTRRSPSRNETRELRRPSKSPGRTKSPSRANRTKPEPSPERSTRRKSTDLSKSPTRTRPGHLTPTRRSPIRGSPRSNKDQEKFKSNSAKVSEPSAIPVLTKKKKLVEVDTDSDTADEKIEVKEKPKAAVRGRTRVNLVEKVEEEKEVPVVTPTPSSQLVVKRVTRSQQKEVERIVHLRHFEPEAAKKLSEFSDEDVEFVKESSVSPKIRKTSGFASLAGVFILLIGLPFYGLYLYNACSGKQCFFTKTPEKISLSLSTYFNLKATLGYVSYILLLTILNAIPFGGWKVTALPDKHGKFVYVNNGLFSALIVLTLSAALELYNIPVLKFIIDHTLHLFVAALLTGVSLSVLAYVRSFYVPVSALNPKIVNKNKFYNFVVGRELHPRIFRIIDLKMFVYKTLVITELLIIVAYLYKGFQATKNPQLLEEEITKRLLRLSPTFLVYSSLQLIRLLDRLVYEKSWITSKEIQQEGFGYDMSVNYLIYPFISSFILKYIVEQRVELAYWKLALISLIYLVGHIIARSSDNLKDSFRKNPYNSNFSNLTTIPTNQGKKLLVSGLWGFVRHPNYLGSIITELATVPFVACAPPVLIRWFNVSFLINRARTDNEHCKQKYGMAWDRYCNRVRYLLVPKLY